MYTFRKCKYRSALLILFFSFGFSFLTDAAGRKEKPLYQYPVFPLSQEEFYKSFDYNLPALSKVKAAFEKKDFSKAAKELRIYFQKNSAFPQKIYNISDLISSNAKQADAEILLKRTYTFQGATHTFLEGMDWLYNPTRLNGKEVNPEWVASNVRFRNLPVLAKAYRATHDERFATEVIYLMRDFIQKFPVPFDEKQTISVPIEIDWLVYSKLSVSERLKVTILSLFSVIESPSLSNEDFVLILQGVYNHLLRMEKYPYLNYHNMGVVDAQVLQKAAVTLPEFQKAKGWGKWAFERGLDQMENVVYPDGVEKELCPRYHQGVMLTFAGFMSVSKAAGLPAPAGFTEKLKSMAAFLVKISRPDGTIPAFSEMVQTHGDSREIRKKIRAIARDTDDNGTLNWFGHDGASGTKPVYESIALNWAGYYVMRSGWGVKDNYMAIKAGPYGTAHQQEDKLSFELFAQGELFLIDPGFYVYNKQSLWRKYFQSSLAHNTVVPDRLSQYRYGKRFLYENKKPNDALWITNKKYDFLSATYNNGYADYKYIGEKNPEPVVNISHQRDILFIKPGLWLILDWLDPEDTKEHLYESLFQSRFEVSTIGKDLLVKGKSTNLRILPLVNKENALQINVTSGQAEPFKRGWIYDVNKAKNFPLSTAVISQKAVGSAVQAYFIIPEKGNSNKLNHVEVIHVDGGIGGKLVTVDGVTISFIAQKKPGKFITAGSLTTSGRIKVHLVNANHEQFEIVE